MSCGCNNYDDVDYYYDDDIAGLDKSDIGLIIGVPLGYVATAKLDNYLAFDEDGNLKDGALAEDPEKRQGLYVFVGGLTYYLGGRPESGKLGTLLKGLGLGSATFGIKEWLRAQYPDQGIFGMKTHSDHAKTIAGKRKNSQLQKTIGTANRNMINFQQNGAADRNITTIKVKRA